MIDPQPLGLLERGADGRHGAHVHRRHRLAQPVQLQPGRRATPEIWGDSSVATQEPKSHRHQAQTLLSLPGFVIDWSGAAATTGPAAGPAAGMQAARPGVPAPVVAQAARLRGAGPALSQVGRVARRPPLQGWPLLHDARTGWPGGSSRWPAFRNRHGQRRQVDDRNLLSCHWPSGIIGRVGAGCGVMTGGSAFQRRLATNAEFTKTSAS